MNGVRDRPRPQAVPRRIAPLRRRKWSLSALLSWIGVGVVFALLMAQATGLFDAQPAEPITIDGDLSDWGYEAWVPSGITVPHYQRFSQGWAYLLLRAPLDGGDGLMDLLRVYIDTDADPNTGFVVGRLGADARVTVEGMGGKVLSASYCFRQPNVPWWDSEQGWAGCRSPAAAAAPGGVEIALRRWSLEVGPHEDATRAVWYVERHTADGKACATWGTPRTAWQEKVGSTWRDGVRVDGEFDDWQVVKNRSGANASWSASRVDLRRFERVVSVYNSSFLIGAVPTVLDGVAMPVTRHPPPVDGPPSGGGGGPQAVVVIDPRPPARLDVIELRFVNATAFRVLSIEGWQGRVVSAGLWTNATGDTMTAFAASVKGRVEAQIPGFSWLGNLTVIARSWNWSEADAVEIGPMEGPNPPDLRDISGNIVYYLRDTAHASETACSVVNKLASTVKGSGPVATVTLDSDSEEGCWYADGTTSTTTDAGSWETLLDLTALHLPAYQALGTMAVDPDAHVDLVVTIPTHAAGDILLLQASLRDQDETASVSGWTALTGSPFDTTTGRYWFWYARASSGSMTNPTVDFSGTTGDAYGQIITYRYAVGTGDPWEVVGSWSSTGTNPLPVSGITSLTANSLIVVAGGYEDNDLAGCSITAADPASFTTHYTETTSGNDWAMCFGEALRTTAGATGAISVNYGGTLSDQAGAFALALKPSFSYTVFIEVWNLVSNAVDSVIGSCPAIAATGDDIQCLVSGVASKVITSSQVVRVRVRLVTVGTSGGITISFDDSDSSGDSRLTLPVPEFQEVAVPIAGAVLVVILARRARCRKRE